MQPLQSDPGSGSDIRRAVPILIGALLVGQIVFSNMPIVYVPVMAALFAVPLLRDRSRIVAAWNSHRMGIAVFGVFLAVCLLSALWAVEAPWIAIERAVKLSAWWGIAAVLLVAPIRPGVLREGVVGLALGSAALGIVLFENGVFGEVRTIFIDPENWHLLYNFHKVPATLLALCLFPLGAVAFVRRDRGLRWGFAVALTGLLASGYPTGILAAVLGGGAALLAVRFPMAIAAAFIVVAAAILFAAPHLLAGTDLSPLLEATKFDPSLQHRVLIWDFASQAIDAHPWLGWGLDASRYLPHGSDRVVETASRLGRVDVSLLHEDVRHVAQNLSLHPHDIFLQVRLELGIPGAIAVLLALTTVLRRILRIDDVRGRAVCLGAMTAASFLGAFSFGAWQSWWLSVLILLAVGCRVALCYRRLQAVG